MAGRNLAQVSHLLLVLQLGSQGGWCVTHTACTPHKCVSPQPALAALGTELVLLLGAAQAASRWEQPHLEEPELF